MVGVARSQLSRTIDTRRAMAQKQQQLIIFQHHQG
jgi:hypothetical protein